MRDDKIPAAEMSRRQALKTMAVAPVVATMATPAEPILKFQRPDTGHVEPLVTFTAQDWNQGGWHSAITRIWPQGTTPARCGRCPLSACSLTKATCMVLTREYVADDDAPDFRRSAPAPK